MIPPSSRIGPVSPAEREALVKNSLVAGVYDQTTEDRDSAYEHLTGRVASRMGDNKPAGGNQVQRTRINAGSDAQHRHTEDGGFFSKMGGMIGDVGQQDLAAQPADGLRSNDETAARAIGSEVGRVSCAACWDRSLAASAESLPADACLTASRRTPRPHQPNPAGHHIPMLRETDAEAVIAVVNIARRTFEGAIDPVSSRRTVPVADFGTAYPSIPSRYGMASSGLIGRVHRRHQQLVTARGESDCRGAATAATRAKKCAPAVVFPRFGGIQPDFVPGARPAGNGIEMLLSSARPVRK